MKLGRKQREVALLSLQEYLNEIIGKERNHDEQTQDDYVLGKKQYFGNTVIAVFFQSASLQGYAVFELVFLSGLVRAHPKEMKNQGPCETEKLCRKKSV